MLLFVILSLVMMEYLNAFGAMLNGMSPYLLLGFLIGDF